MFGLKSNVSSILLGLLFWSGTAQAVCYNMNAEQDDSLHKCTNMPEYNPHLSCCPSDAVCLDNGLCLSPSNNSLEVLSYQGCTWYFGAGEACPGAEYCRLKNETGYQYPKGTKWNIIPCPNGKYCCSVDAVSADCCAAEADTFEVGFGRVRDSTTTSYSTSWATTTQTGTVLSETTYTRTATETVCPTTAETLASEAVAATPAAAAESTVAPALAARFTA